VRARAPLHLLLSLLTLAASRGAAQDTCHDDASVRVTAVGTADQATAHAVSTLLAPGNPATPSWELVIAGPRTVVRHVRSAEHFARTLAPESTAYDRALASIELLNAARAAACGNDVAVDAAPAPEPEPVPSPPVRSETSLGVMAGVRFDADPDGPWMIRPTVQLDVGLLRGGAVHLVVGVQASGFGVFAREAEQADLEVRYERHDVALELGGALALDALTLSARVSVGVTVRDVSVLDGDTARAHRVDAAATLGAVIALRVPLVGPLGLRLSGELVGVPSPITYRVAGDRVITEGDLRLAGSVGLDLEL
jgi:hypothetical protein